MPDTAETWKKRVASWRASGETAEVFSEGRPWKPQTLRWWASRLKRDDVQAPVIRLAQVVRSAEREGGAVIVELLECRVQITVEANAPTETVAAVLGILMAREDS